MKRNEMIYKIMLPYVIQYRDDKKIDNKQFCDTLLGYLEQNGMLLSEIKTERWGIIVTDPDKLTQTIDASVWAKTFMEMFKDRHEEIDEELMLTWFANAIMTGSDRQYYRMQPKIDKLKGLLLLTDPSVSNEEMNSLSAKQWSEYIKTFPEEGNFE